MKITLTKPDDWHLHVRDGDAMRSVVPLTARRFGRAIIMPNLRPAVTRVEQARAYYERILDAAGETGFQPLMTLYLTDNTSADDIREAVDSGIIHGVKLYPAGATTNSDEGVTDITRCDQALDAMQQSGLPLLVHGEVTDEDVDVFDREKIFIDRVLMKICNQFPALRIVFEHITTHEAVDFVLDSGSRIGATITAHHLMYNRNAMFRGGLRPHHYCLPVLKRERHRQALLRAATSGHPKFFLGTDSAPHARQSKESTCGCAGIFTAHAAIEFYASVFDRMNALDRLEGFASFHGADFYGLPRNTETVTLERTSQTLPAAIPLGNDELVPLMAGESIDWTLS